MIIFGIEFAPLWIPLERRLQTAIVAHFCATFFFLHFNLGIIACVALWYYTSWYWPPLLYLAWLIFDLDAAHQGGRQVKALKDLTYWKYFRDYFPIKLVKTADIDPKKNYIFCYHPHGILCFGASTLATNACDFDKLFPGIKSRVLMLQSFFWIPFHRELALATGACAASAESIEWFLSEEKKGYGLILVVGGATEAMNAHRGTSILTLKKRTGFVKMALKHGASLVPVYAFGENDLYNQVKNPEGSLLWKFQTMWKNITGFPFPIIYGRGIFQYTFGMLPVRKPVTVVVGKPIDVEKIPEPTKEDIERTHQLYIEKLTELFEEHKTKYGPNLELKIT